MKSQDIRKKFQKYFIHQGHSLLESTSLIPQKDRSLLFTNAGMNPFKDYFLRLAEPPQDPVCSIQKCMRAGGKHNDLEQVGLSPYHHTFFEMMGNFSFGAYFKREAIHYALEFLTKELNLNRDKLWISVFKKDTESAEIWYKDHNFTKDKIFLLGEKDNFWRMGDTGPCGPCTEIYYYDGPKKNPQIKDMTEIWNLVFMEFNEINSAGKIKKTPLPKPAVDTGMGLERLSAVLQGKTNNYHTDLFKNIISSLEKATGIFYDFEQGKEKEHQVAFQVLADHSRAIAFLIGDGVLPVSDGAGYVLRRLLRRALFYGQKLTLSFDVLTLSTQSVVEEMGDIYPALRTAKDLIKTTVQKETQLFSQSLKEGRSVLLKKITPSSGKIEDHVVWDLYSTYGFPPDLTRLIAQEKGCSIRALTLNELKNKFSTPSSKKVFQNTAKEELIKKMLEIYQQKKAPHLSIKAKTQFTGYKTDEEQGQVLLALSFPQLKSQGEIKGGELQSMPFISQGESGFVIMDKTCFYPEGGGPIGDKGVLLNQVGLPVLKARVWDTQKRGDIIIHDVKVIDGQVQTGQFYTMKVDKAYRRLISASHSATHLLHKALKLILGKEVRQMGSLVQPGNLRFDFSHSSPISKQQIKEIENKVNSFIQAEHKVSDSLCSYKEAVNKGAYFLAGENYPKKVRLIQMGDSLEFCGGIHVKNTLDIGGFKIISETGVKSGVRRIVAYVNDFLLEWLTLMAQQNEEVLHYLNLSLPRWPELEEKNPFVSIIKKKEEEIIHLKNQLKKLSASFSGSIGGLAFKEKARTFKCRGSKAMLWTVALPIEDRKVLAETADNIKSQALEPSVVVAIGEGTEQCPIVVTVAGELQKDISAKDLLKNIIADFLKGKGGGQARFAQGTIRMRSHFPQLGDLLIKHFEQLSL